MLLVCLTFFIVSSVSEETLISYNIIINEKKLTINEQVYTSLFISKSYSKMSQYLLFVVTLLPPLSYKNNKSGGRLYEFKK